MSCPMQEPDEAIVELQTLLSEQDDIDELVGIYLLASILEQASSDETVLPSEVGVEESCTSQYYPH